MKITRRNFFWKPVTCLAAVAAMKSWGESLWAANKPVTPDLGVPAHYYDAGDWFIELRKTVKAGRLEYLFLTLLPNPNGAAYRTTALERFRAAGVVPMNDPVSGKFAVINKSGGAKIEIVNAEVPWVGRFWYAVDGFTPAPSAADQIVQPHQQVSVTLPMDKFWKPAVRWQPS